MFHDRIPNDPKDLAAGKRKGWLRALLGADHDAATPPEPLDAPASDSDFIGADELVDLAVLASQLSDLIRSARDRLDGAVDMVDRSADEAADYGRALDASAKAIDAQKLPKNTVEALLNVTRQMIDRTETAEKRLRSTNGELRALQRDLSVAQESAERDPLTGLLNRRALEQALNRAIDTARRADSALSVAFCDIDHFKRLNDVHGHAVGDRVLRLVGDVLAEDADDRTFVGRQGGEEFVVLFEGLPVIEAAARIDEIREALSERTLRSRSDGTPIGRVTFSAGVAALNGPETGEDLLHRADQALYRAKEGGRNQVVIDPGA
ncbi:MAG TPA: GGDEF domain-containing protein [Sphingomonas sp.]|uniref:GGDEF domain-containing protein n=1 Tax=Sphingomonas sp. TaxID=28214 RepID=UPI002C98FC3D|nr:GGDEF domain-containing protein [Sphingomonas sp.]HMI20435.1 GGDEF domain-containing protein [Sphingomonas sp.]